MHGSIGFEETGLPERGHPEGTGGNEQLGRKSGEKLDAQQKQPWEGHIKQQDGIFAGKDGHGLSMCPAPSPGQPSTSLQPQDARVVVAAEGRRRICDWEGGPRIARNARTRAPHSPPALSHERSAGFFIAQPGGKAPWKEPHKRLWQGCHPWGIPPRGSPLFRGSRVMEAIRLGASPGREPISAATFLCKEICPIRGCEQMGKWLLERLAPSSPLSCPPTLSGEPDSGWHGRLC